jgi:hypothetical protein
MFPTDVAHFMSTLCLRGALAVKQVVVQSVTLTQAYAQGAIFKDCLQIDNLRDFKG